VEQRGSRGPRLAAHGRGLRQLFIYIDHLGSLDHLHASDTTFVENYRFDLANIGPYWGWNRIPSPSTVDYTLHITEGARFEFRVCAEYQGIVLTAYCSPWANGYA
jgi:hypothetical protein